MSDLIDRQAAIDALKICDNNEDGINCHKCPLRDERWDGAWQDDETNCYTKLMRDSAKLLELQSVHPELSNNSPKLDKEIGECNDCIKHGGDWECDRVHCHKGDVPDTNVGELISRQKAKDAIDMALDHIDHVPPWVYDKLLNALNEVPSVQPRKKGKWIGYNADDKDWQRDDGSPIFMNCSECHGAVINNGSAHWNFCPNCGCRMEEGDAE